jgi:hypothetical protein
MTTIATVPIVADVMGALLPEVYRPNCCIAATRIACHVFEQLGVRADPMVVMTCAFSPGWARYVIQHDGATPPRDEWRDDVWSVGLGVPDDEPPPPGTYPADASVFNGHMIALLTFDSGQRVIVDPSLGQGHRPDHDLPLPQVGIVPLRPSESFEPRDQIVRYDPESGVALMYQRMADPPEYEHATDWAGMRVGMVAAHTLHLVRRRIETCHAPSGAA